MPQRFRVHENQYPYFITSTIVHWIPVFCRDDYFQILVDSFKYCIEHKGLVVHSHVMMPHHFHAICSHLDDRLSDVMRDLKRHTSSMILKKLEEDSRSEWLRAMKNAGKEAGTPRVWMREFHPEQVYSQEFYEQKVNYIHNNPVRAGFVTDPAHWKYSSAGYYYHEAESVIPVTPIDW